MANDYWEKEVETLSRDKLRKIQLERLKKTLVNVYENVDFYRKKLDDAGVDPYNFSNLDDVEKIPFTTKDDLLSEKVILLDYLQEVWIML
jgi:phenylacetate-CoA ligase